MRAFIQWDSVKSNKNMEKHGIAFDEAATVFFDQSYLSLYDEDHSVVEDRYIVLGQSSFGRVLFVAYTHRRSKYEEEVEYYRIISARFANKGERKAYKNHQER
ncbi:BrnT family toxin [Bdellovibrio svalbardensis]|uniref:BrnT family toxin n=1 Tax=Bdellovibrio svalbardensis TaxID=2972972 RepID=A0ABT6DKE3_9BACT|nr:BrnT family toxin [Bdellovibrio svalbardensis]MDG0817334.1 BrnT family toxin [Bdellovibrio svalbardensis]